MTEAEAERRAKEAAATYYADSLLGEVASMEAVEVSKRALLALGEAEYKPGYDLAIYVIEAWASGFHSDWTRGDLLRVASDLRRNRDKVIGNRVDLNSPWTRAA